MLRNGANPAVAVARRCSARPFYVAFNSAQMKKEIYKHTGVRLVVCRGP